MIYRYVYMSYSIYFERLTVFVSFSVLKLLPLYALLYTLRNRHVDSVSRSSSAQGSNAYDVSSRFVAAALYFKYLKDKTRIRKCERLQEI